MTPRAVAAGGREEDGGAADATWPRMTPSCVLDQQQPSSHCGMRPSGGT